MAWKIKHEWIDLAKSRHEVVFHNPDTGAEHRLIHEFQRHSCASCGRPTEEPNAPIDFHQVKLDVLADLEEHHRKHVAAYLEKHPHVHRGHGPK